MNQKLSWTRTCVVALLFAVNGVSERPDLVFSGDFQRVTDVSISIRLADGRIIEVRNTQTHGQLSPGALAKRYGVGDQVKITCSPIKGVYSQLIGRSLDLQLKKLQLLRAPSAEEAAKALASKAWRQSPNLLRTDRPWLPAPEESQPPAVPPAEPGDGPGKGPALDWPARLAQIRAHILEFVAEMPNFVADEVARRYVSNTKPPDWRLVDTIESEITFRGSAISRQNMVVNGKPWNSPYRALPGFKWTDAFGSQLRFLFDPTCPTTFEPGGRVNEGDRSLPAGSYSSPPDGCEFYWQDYQQFYPGKTGRILLDEGEENVIRLETNSEVFPEAFPISAIEKRVSWDFVKIGDAVHVLPVAAEITVVLSNGEMRLAKHEYRNHRHFEAASKVTFH